MNVPDPGDTARLCMNLPLSVISVPADTLTSAGLLFLLCLLLCALCSAAEEAVLSSSSSKLRKLAEDGRRSALKVLEAGEEESNFSAAMQSGRISFAIAGAVVLAAGCTRAVRDLLKLAGLSAFANQLATILVAVIALLLLLSFGVRMPKELAAQHPEESAMRLIGPANLIRTLLTPITAVARFFGRIAVRLSGGDPNAPEEDVTEEEIREMVDAGEELGAIEETEKDMIANILDFNDITVGQVMTHRTDVVALEDSESPAVLVQTAIENGFSRIPVYQEDLDNVVGVCNIKDYLPYIGKPIPKDLRITDRMRPVYFIPESKKCSQLFTEMTERKMQFAVVVDEYGGTAGIITMEDLVESIVGNIQDEYDQEEPDTLQVNENTFEVDGATPVDEIGSLTGEELPEGDYDTLAGFVVEQLGTIPKEGEHHVVNYRSLTITVQEVEDRRISRLRIERDPDWAPEEDADE